MKVQQKNIAVCIILSIVTCGLYSLYWLYTLTEDMKVVSNNPNGTSGGMVVILSIVTCHLYQLYWLYKQGESVDIAKSARGIPSSNTGIVYLLLSIVGFDIIAWVIMQNEINKLAQ